MENKKLISIVTPVFNEEENISFYHKTITEVTNKLEDKYNFEFVITDNASTDKTFQLLVKISNKDPRFRIFKLSRNFGYQKSLWTGYSKARGDAVICFDCDLQDPPELLEQFLTEWEKGTMITYGERILRAERFLKTKQMVDLPYARKFFYYLLNRMSEHDIPKNAGDFMLLDKQVVDLLKEIKDHNIYLRGTIFGLGFSRKGIPYKRKLRRFGKTKFNFGISLKLALDGLISQSTVPLKIASLIGMGIAFLTMCLSGFYILSKFFFDINMPDGLTTIIVLTLFGISLNGLFLGIIGEYIARIYDQQKNKPITIIEKEIDHSSIASIETGAEIKIVN